MSDEPMADDRIASVALLAEPNRQRLYDLVIASGEPVGRDDAAAALGMSRELAAFHLDRLVDAGLLVTEHRRRGTRSGPGAGRPAKFYRRAARDLAISLPPRHYDLAADLMATTLDALGASGGAEALAKVAHTRRNAATGDNARAKAGPRPRSSALRDGTRSRSDRRPASEPQVRLRRSKTVRLRNCPYDAWPRITRDLTCGMNLAWGRASWTRVGALRTVQLDPAPGRCCVTFDPPAETRRRRSSRIGTDAAGLRKEVERCA